MRALSGFLGVTLVAILAPAIVGIMHIDWLRTQVWTLKLLYVASAWLAVAPAYVVLQAARSTRVPRPLVLLPAACLAFGVGEGHAALATPPRSAEVWPVEAAFREAVQLWADERFEDLWERGLLASRYRVPREVFVRGMRQRVFKLTCCWGQLRDVRVHLQGTEEAIIEAQVGVDQRTLGTTKVRRMLVYLRREEGGWRVALEDFLTKPEDGLLRDLPVYRSP
jgi:hypothetical protein